MAPTTDDYQICTRCVMDTSDPDIKFDEQGVCNHCHDYDRVIREYVFCGEEGRQKLEAMAGEIKREGAGNDYDCILGMSGGVDSTFVAYKAKQLGLRPLAIHLDNKWNTEIADANIKNAVRKLGIDLQTHKVDWEEFRDLQLAFLMASTPDSEIPSDHAIVSLMYQVADKLKVKYVLIGRNYRTESHGVPAWSTGHFDWKYIRSVHRQFGSIPLRTYPHRTPREQSRYHRRQVWFDILNYVDYRKEDAVRILQEELGWQDYGGKHYESIYTRFVQGYILPEKFGYDKRKMHFSSLICSAEMTRSEALKQLKQPTYPPSLQEEDRVHVLAKLGLSEQEFTEIMQLPKKTIYDYPSYTRDRMRIRASILRFIPDVWGKIKQLGKKVLQRLRI
jgi:N-acetyl sugar amidotransferase